MKKYARKIITVLLVIAMLIPSVAMLYSSAAISDFSVELAFNNIFVFEKWASNKLSTTIVNGGVPITDKLTIDTDNGIFTFENKNSGEAYTGHGMGTGTNSAGNFQYYMMEVEPGAAYTFSCNLTGLTSGLIFTPYIFFFDENGSYTSLVPQSVSSTGNISFVFFVPTNVSYIQIRFTLSDTGSAEAKDIAIRKTDVSSYGSNIFSFAEWAGNTLSSKVSDMEAYNGGAVAKNTADNSVTLTTDATIATKGVLFTNFTFGNGDGYYMMPVNPSSTYNFSYNLASCNFDVALYQPYVVFYDASKNFISYINSSAVDKGVNRFVFTTPANAAYIQIVYGIVGIAEAEKTCTVKDVAIQKLTLATDTNAGVTHRKVYTYSKSNPRNYGELPVPSYAPSGYVFAGWYTGVNGTGTHITENTPVDFTSHTVYPKYEPVVDSLSIRTIPVKTSYTVGERVNPTGLVLEYAVADVTSTIESGYYCTPEYLTATGTQTVTAHYGGKTATYTVNVSASLSESVVVNGATVNASVTNNAYTFASTVANSDFHRYKLTYYSDAYVEGIITYGDNTTEQFFLEPSSNFDDGMGKFTSFVDGYLKKYVNASMKMSKVTSSAKKGIKSISFTLLDNEAGTFNLLSVTTEKRADMPSTMTGEATVMSNTIKTFRNEQYKVGIDILNGGAVYQLYLLNSNIVARVYNINGTDVTKVDYRDKLDATYGTKYKSESTEVNLINYYDNGRELQQSYYGTGEKPYEQGYYNSADWNYNPVQAGNVVGEASKVIDYEIGEDYIYIKARPLDWAKWSDEWAETNPNVMNYETGEYYKPIYGDGYVTDTYIEARYVFENGLMKTYCRMVDYSGFPSAQTTQELPAFYTIEPLNQYVYNDVTEDNAWQEENLVYDSEPEFWGITQDYIKNCYPNGFSANKNTPEHWAAFMASQDADSFGIGLYTPEVTDFYYGVYPPKHSGAAADNMHYRHAVTLNPAKEVNTSYIAPIGVRVFESYKPTEYEFYISTGTVEQIRNSFGVLDAVCDHSNTHVEHKASTCTEEGYQKVICDDCGETVSASVVPKKEHCYEGGVCTMCGKEAVIIKHKDSTTVIDYSNRFIYGLTSGLNIDTVFSEYVTHSDKVYYQYGANKVGTDKKVMLYDSNTNELVSEYTFVVFGDVNGDGWYDGQDAVLVSCLVNGMLTQDDVSEAVYMAADCNHDGAVDRLDVTLLNKAGTLRASVEQSKPAKELLETSSAYVEYLALIDQTPEIEVEDEQEDVIIPDTNEDVDSDETTAEFDFVTVITGIFDLIKNLISVIFSFIIG